MSLSASGDTFVELIKALASPAEAGDARARVKEILLRGAALCGAYHNPNDEPSRDLDAGSSAKAKELRSWVDDRLSDLDNATAAVRSADLIDEIITELGPGGLTRLATLYGTSAARMSAWRKSAPTGVDVLTILKATWLLAGAAQEPVQAAQPDTLNIVANIGSDAIENMSSVGPFIGPDADTTFLAFERALGRMADRIPLKIAMFAREEVSFELGKDTVPPALYPHSSIVFIGEAPGTSEVVSGEPFSGLSGKLLWETIFDKWKEDGQTLYFGDFGLTNVFLTRPTNNKVSEFFGSTRSKDTVHDLPAFTYRYILKEQLPSLVINASCLAESKPVVIVALGAVAAWALLGRSDISNFRGTFTTVDYGPFQAKVMATFHPAYVIRDKRRLGAFNDDIAAAIKQMKAERWF